MPHNDDMEENKTDKINQISIVLAENGFIYHASSDSSPHKDYVYENIEDVLAAVKDDLDSPHLRSMKPEDGELTAKGAKNPEGLAAYMGRKKYGKEKMNAWAAKGKEKLFK